MKLYNTLSHKKEIFKPIKNKRVGVYACGPTVYWHAHIGNLRTYIFSDVLKRILEYNNYKVKYVMNFTDVDDKTIKGTIEKYRENANKKNLRAYTERYIKIFKSDIKKLNIEFPFFIRATDAIQEMKKIIKELLKKHFAYIKDNSVYFDIQKYEQKYNDYGVLAGKDFMRGIKFGKTISEDEYEKENIGDFVLWKKWNKKRDKNIYWDDEILGKGRPGWHIECSAISIKEIGKQFDVHMGGKDLIFPHHTNEIAQSQAFTKKVPFVKYWLHAEHLMVDNEKMSKSKKNLYTLKDIEKKFDALSFRYLCLTSRYNSKLNFTWKSLEASQNALKNLYEKVSDLKTDCSEKIAKNSNNKYKKKFLEFINDDIDTPKALSLIWKMLNNKNISSQEKYRTCLDFDRVLGLSLDKVKKIKIPLKIRELADIREKYRKDKNWQKADEIRKKIEKLGYRIEDTKNGIKIKK
ncbi:MAG: cysteine--tRNA ligase [Patescibacteria group bacterium]|nr:cysteine--tRNA ligase [Patescibacteria group bacterium]